MNNILDNFESIKKLDSQKMYSSIELLPEQIKEVWRSAEGLKIPAHYKKANRMVLMGMGGSALGMHIIKSLYFDYLKIPIEIINGYNLPAYADKNTLVLCSSYSGSTEEVLSAVAQAYKQKTKLITISSGGKLADFARAHKIPALVFAVNNNPCGSPRMGLGYSIFGQLILLSKIGLIKFGQTDLNLVLKVIKKYSAEFGIKTVGEVNLAKKFAKEIFGKTVWYAGAEHLSGSTHTAANQMNENAKRFCGWFLIPELNHHLLEGMLYPETNTKNLTFIFLSSHFYDKRVQKRFVITREILEKDKIKSIVYNCSEKSRLGQACEVLLLGSFVSYYSALLQGIDPTAIPFVDYFKAALKKK